MEDEEWEDVIVVSYVPLPITWDEHPDHAKFSQLMQKLTLSAQEITAPVLEGWAQPKVISVNPVSKTELAVVYSSKPTEPWIYDRTAKYKHTGTGCIASIDASSAVNVQTCGQYIWSWTNGRPKFTIMRVDSRTNESQTLEIDNPGLPKPFHIWASGRYAYVWNQSSTEVLIQHDILTKTQTDLTNEIFELLRTQDEPARRETERFGFLGLKYPYEPLFYDFDRNKIAIVFHLATLSNSSPRIKVALLSESTGKFLHSAEESINTAYSGFWLMRKNSEMKVIKEGLLIKEIPSSKSSNTTALNSVTRLYSLSDLRLRAVFRSQLSSMYPLLWANIHFVRVGGIPVIFDSLNKEQGKTIANFIFLYGNRFHPIGFKTKLSLPNMQVLESCVSCMVGPRHCEMLFGVRYQKQFSFAKVATFAFSIQV